MISFWREIFTDRKNDEVAFLWMINGQGNVVVVRTERLGLQPGEKFAVASDWREMVKTMLYAVDFVKPHVFDRGATWGDVLNVLNGPRCPRKRDYEEIHYALMRLGIDSPLENDIGRGNTRINWRLRAKPKQGA